jgi:hypothetical protein
MCPFHLNLSNPVSRNVRSPISTGFSKDLEFTLSTIVEYSSTTFSCYGFVFVGSKQSCCTALLSPIFTTPPVDALIKQSFVPHQTIIRSCKMTQLIRSVYYELGSNNILEIYYINTFFENKYIFRHDEPRRELTPRELSNILTPIKPFVGRGNCSCESPKVTKAERPLLT